MLIEELARAKVNLTLQVLGRRADGYHALASVVAFASVADVVTLDTARPVGVEISGPFAPRLPSEFLVARTLAALTAREPRLRLGAVRLEKRLPVAAGIGGGSADAAAVLRAVRRANADFAEHIDWSEIAVGLGADVPVCLANQLTFMTGIGDVLRPLPPLREPIRAVLVNPQIIVPNDKTAQVFRALCAGPWDGVEAMPAVVSDAGDVVAALSAVGNDLEAPAQVVMPVVTDVLAVLRTQPGCRLARMSGAGPTCFAIFDDPDNATLRLRQRYPTWWVEAVDLT